MNDAREALTAIHRDRSVPVSPRGARRRFFDIVHSI